MEDSSCPEQYHAEGRKKAQANVQGDSLRHPVVFDGKTLRQIAPEDVARLHFAMPEGGRFYSFTTQ